MNRIILPNINCDHVTIDLVAFIQSTMDTEGFKQVILGLSGGVDSALSCALAVRALGKENVYVYYLPYRTSNPQNLDDSIAVAESLGLDLKAIEITEPVEALARSCDIEYLSTPTGANKVRLGNIMARVRMILLYDLSAKHRALVLGTGNRTETLLGYTTLYGDNASALNPNACLYKTHIFELARYLKIPDQVIDKAPSADLWPGQTDEADMKVTYVEADTILHALFDLNIPKEELPSRGFDPVKVQRIIDLHFQNRFKNRLALTPNWHPRWLSM